MLIGIHPTVDYAFKHLFGRERTRALLIHLANSVLVPRIGHTISHLDLLNPFNPKESLDDKLSILDIKARDQDGRQFNLEMPFATMKNGSCITGRNFISSNCTRARIIWS